jgi:hypothetical protein
MKKYNVGIICPSEIAFRRFLPSLQRVEEFQYVGVAIASPEEWAGEGNVTEATLAVIDKERQKAQTFVENYGGRFFEGYQMLIESPDVDVVYLPLPPALHYKWAKRTLEAGKNAYVEKPFTTSLEDTQALLSIAKEKKLAVHENYMFVFHKQLHAIKDLIAAGEIGKVRQYRVSFGFPRREANDFRYNKALGGGALLDAGGYCLKYASWLLGDSAKLVCANAYFEPEFEVDIFGSATMVNEEGTVVQMSFGMDCDYKCELEAWGSTGTLTTGRILTAPDGLEPDMVIKRNQDLETRKLPADNAFEKSIRHFYKCLVNAEQRVNNYMVIERQSSLVTGFKELSKK